MPHLSSISVAMSNLFEEYNYVYAIRPWLEGNKFLSLMTSVINSIS